MQNVPLKLAIIFKFMEGSESKSGKAITDDFVMYRASFSWAHLFQTAMGER